MDRCAGVSFIVVIIVGFFKGVNSREPLVAIATWTISKKSRRTRITRPNGYADFAVAVVVIVPALVFEYDALTQIVMVEHLGGDHK